ncbi:hypothetical protein AAMO2058_000000300 [Amorphochlora amoebiformis]
MIVGAVMRGIFGIFGSLPQKAQLPAIVIAGCVGSTVIYEGFVMPKNKPSTMSDYWVQKNKAYREHQNMDPISKK